MTKYSVQLTEEQRQEVKHLIGSGVAPARQIMHAQILLKSDRSEAGPRWTDQQIQDTFGVGETQVKHVRQRFVENGLQDALCRRPQPPRPDKRVLNGRHEAYVIALTCSPKPEGYEHWSVRLLAHKMVELGYLERVGRETIRLTLTRNELKPWLKEQWCIPPKKNAEFVCHMEDILDVYHLPYDPKRPQVCMDEGSKQLLSDKRERLPMDKGKPERYDNENGREP